MLTILEILIIITNIPALIWALLPVKKVPRFLDFMPLSSVIFMILHLFIDNETVPLRFIPLYIFTITVFLITMVRIFRHNPNQPKHRILASVGSLLGLLVLTICVFIPTQVIAFNSLPEPTGNYNVGTVVSDFTDKNRIETYSNVDGTNRKIAVQFWYPADRTGSSPKYDISGAPVSASQPKYPVLIFSHGAFGVRMSNASTFRELASHGYIVASIDHTYHSFFASFADGRKIPVDTKFLNDAQKVSNDLLPEEETFKITHDWLDLRTADIEFLIDSLKSNKLDGDGSLLNGHLDFDKIGLFGHSLGGAASAQVTRERNDIDAAIVIDGTMIGDITAVSNNNKETITDKNFTKPLMLMYGSLFLEPEGKETGYLPNINAFNNAQDAAYSLCIKGSGHLNFTDLPRISPFLSNMLGVGAIDSFRCIKIVNDYSLAFFDRHLKDQPSQLLDGAVVYDEVIFEKK